MIKLIFVKCIKAEEEDCLGVAFLKFSVEVPIRGTISRPTGLYSEAPACSFFCSA